MQSPDFGLIANAYGIPHRKVEKLADVVPALQEAIDHKGAMVLEFICDPAEVILPMIPSGGGFEDMLVKHPKKKSNTQKKEKSSKADQGETA